MYLYFRILCLPRTVRAPSCECVRIVQRGQFNWGRRCGTAPRVRYAV